MQTDKVQRQNRRDKKRRPPLSDRLRNALEVPFACAAGMSSVELYGGRQAVIGGCESVLTYSEEEIVLRVKEGNVHLLGKRMEMQSLICDCISVRGEIHTVTIEKSMEKKP